MPVHPVQPVLHHRGHRDRSYADGDNSVTVSGVTADKITLKFGEGTTSEDTDLFLILSSAVALADFTSERVFEESGKGILASL